MIARFDHRPMLTAVLALSTIVLVVVVLTLATLLYTASRPAATSSSVTDGGNSGVAAAPANPDAGERQAIPVNDYGNYRNPR